MDGWDRGDAEKDAGAAENEKAPGRGAPGEAAL